ncbi:ROK family protein [candidate division GN15 bacterium]|nr:ROK family protein [candidate division GN15 bacterium]
MAHDSVYAGIDIGATNIKYGLVDGEGKVLFREQRPTVAEKGADALMHLVTNIAERLLLFAAEDEFDVRWLGVGTPGAVDIRTGTVIGPSPNIAGWQGMEIGSILADRINMPVWVDNDVNVMALAESRFGAAVGFESVVCAAIGTGVGGGIMLNGKVWRGASFAAGELGHMSINFDGPGCHEEMRGCIESYCCSQAILSRARARLEHGLTPVFEEVLQGSLDNLNIKKLFSAARKGDETAAEIIAETADYLAIGLAGIVNLLNPQIVIIGGGIADGGAGFVEAVSAGIRKRAFESATRDLRVSKATLGNDAGFIGAAILGETAH